MIEINNLTTVAVDEEFLKNVAKSVLERENKVDAELSIALVGQGKIRELNKKYRNKNRTTDVLAFGENSKFKIQNSKLKSVQSLGEIVICLREVKKNAKKYKSTFEKELAKVLIHGILHLLGHDHEKDKNGAELMTAKEQDYLSKVF